MSLPPTTGLPHGRARLPHDQLDSAVVPVLVTFTDAVNPVFQLLAV